MAGAKGRSQVGKSSPWAGNHEPSPINNAPERLLLAVSALETELPPLRFEAPSPEFVSPSSLSPPPSSEIELRTSLFGRSEASSAARCALLPVPALGSHPYGSATVLQSSVIHPESTEFVLASEEKVPPSAGFVPSSSLSEAQRPMNASGVRQLGLPFRKRLIITEQLQSSSLRLSHLCGHFLAFMLG